MVTEPTLVGQNVELRINGDTLTITVDLSHECGRSKSGKSMVVATTGGNVTVPGTDVKLGLNLYK